MNNQVFFITSNQSKLDKSLEYSLSIKNLKNILTKTEKFKNENFTIRVFSFDIVEKLLKKKDPNEKKYKAIIELKQKFKVFSTTFSGIILFKEGKNNYIYDFEFQEYQSWTGNTSPPIHIRLSKCKQLKIYNEMLNLLKIKQADKLSLDLVLDSQLYLKGKKYELDFYLEILRRCYSNKEVKTLLMMFKLERVILPEKMEIKDYSSILNLIEKKPKVIIKYCTEKDNEEKYYKLFYSLLLYFRANYEKEKVQSLLSQEGLRKYFIEILSENSSKFSNIEVSDDLIIDMIKQKNITFAKIKGALTFIKSIEKLLTFINSNIDLIFEYCTKESQQINMSEMANPKEIDNLNAIINEIQKIINYQSNKNKIFITFNEQFWENYIHYNDKKNVKNLVLINKAILLCKDIDKSLNLEKYNLKNKIHETGLEAIRKGELKNEALIDFIENDDVYFKDNNYATKKDRTLEVLKGIDLETVDDKFYEKWNKSNIFKIYSFIDYEFKQALVNKVDDMKDFGKLLKLFNYNDKYTDIFLKDKFKKLILTYKIDECPNFIKDVSYFIYIIDKKYQGIKDFMKDVIEKNIKSVETMTDIYLYLSSNYKDISKDAIDNITNYFTKNKDKLKGESILFLFQKINSPNLIKSLLDKIDNFVIKEEELFSQEEEIDSFKLLKGIEEEKLMEKIPGLNEAKYLSSTLNLGEKILNKIKIGDIKYNIFNSMWLSKKKILEERLNILLFNNEQDVKSSMKIFEEYFRKFVIIKNLFRKLGDVFKEFYENTHQNNIIKLETLDKEIKAGNLNIIDKDTIKNRVDELKNIIPDLDKKYKLKSSMFFVHLFRNKKEKDTISKEDDILKETEEEFKKLNSLFKENWITEVDESIIREFYKVLKNASEQTILKELTTIKNYFGLNEFDELKLNKLRDEIVILSKKEIIFQTVNSCIHFISELGVKKTEFSTSLDKLRGELSKNIPVEKIREYGESLKKYGLNVLNPNDEEKECINILNALYSKKGSLKFIMSLTEEDCRTLQELVSESENTFLTVAEIQDMVKCSDFIRRLDVIKDQKDQKDLKTDQELIILLIKELSKSKNISAHFIIYANNSGQIQELFSQKLDKSQATLKQIKNIIKSSNFTLSLNNKEESYLSFSAYSTEEKLRKDINFESLIELRGRAMLTKKLGNEQSKEEKEIFEYNKIFAERVNEIEKINILLKNIAEKGYTENIKIFIEIKDAQAKFSTEKDKFNDYESCSKYLNNILSKTIKIQIDYYKEEKKQLIRYIYGRQFNLLYRCLKNMTNESLAPFLKFLTNDCIEPNVNLDKFDYHYEDLNKDEYICLLENINKFLESFLLKNKIKLDKIYQQNIIKEEYNFKGLYTYLLEDDKAGEVQKGVEEHILNWYHFLTGNPPMAQTILLCNEETSSEEITAFMYRAFKCQYNVVFMIGKIELLNPVKRQVLTGLVNSLFTGHEEEMKSCVAFVYSDKTSSIVQYLERIKGKKKLEHKSKKKGEQILYKENVEIIFSNKSGVGKSKYIEQNIKKNGKKYIYFPFGGEFNRKDVINRLKQIKIKDEEKAAIHLDLYDSKQTDLMKDFLYSFLITKLYGQNETLFYLSKKVEIKIEIPNGFINFFLKFPILSMFENKTEMKIENLPPLIIEEQINSNIQIVCNYLKLLKSGKISDKDLNIKNVSFEYFPEDESIQTKLDAVSLPQKECEDLIKEYIGIKYPTYYQINAFINSLSGQLKKFSMNVQLNAGFLIENGKIINKPNLKKIREIMLNGFIKNTQHFTQGAFEKLLNSQMDTYNVGVKHGEYKEEEQEEVAIKALSNLQEIINFDKIKPSLIFFHEGEGQEFSIISTNEPKEQEYKDLLELRKTPVILQNLVQVKKEEVPESLNNYISFKHKDFLKEIREILNIKNPIYNSDKNGQNKNLKSIEEIVGEYVFTADNFIKMVLILLRIRENIPIIMMGETGCGKTSLIRKLSELINNGESKMKILNIHAGITDKEIYDFLNNKEKHADKNILEEAEDLQKKEEIIKKEREEQGFKYFEKKLWIFLDEINTCNSMGLICEMMTKHSCQGKPLPKNIVFIAACNPYRMVVKDEEPNGLKLKGVKERKLVYTVNPLPHSLLNFVFNFGNLTKKDEESYIKNMVVSPIESFYWKDLENNNENKIQENNNENKIQENNNENNIQENNNEENQKKKGLEFYLKKDIFDQYQKLLDMASNSIIEAQEYVREKNDVSSVSLREIRRFSIFYNFFVEYLRKKKNLFLEIDENEIFGKIDVFYKNLTDYDIYKYSINLSVYVCYYLRLTKKQFRDELAHKMNRYFGFIFDEMPKKEQLYISNNIEMKEGIAKNRALLENLFALFVCVNSKVPLFIVGKPGCSKSLSVQLLFKAMKGEISKNLLFKALPKLMLNSYQGSLGSTSKGVLNIFKKARSILENETEENLSKIISMIYFDEMGLAEHSPNNPLKVIHSELEYDLNEGRKKIAFVGISNWRLDASKMNRGLYLSIPQPDLEDLKLTAQIIAESYNEELAQKNKELFEALAVTYFEYKNELSAKYTIKEDFHGSRDFYHLIKSAMRSLLKKAEKEKEIDIDQHVKENIGVDSLERNFGGLEFDNGISSLEIVKNIFKKTYENCPVGKKYDVIKRIKENINDKGSRYLLLISKSSISNYLLSTILNDKSINKESVFYIGSGFVKDLHSEEYSLKILNRIQLQMEQNKVLLLNDLESVYPALYDLFNQNFTVVSEKNYARIAIGSSNNTFSLINDDFKCIVLVDQNKIDNEEAPFLNRFEKHIISFDYLLKEQFSIAADDIYKIIEDLPKPNIQDNKLSLPYDLDKLIVNCDKEEIRGIIFSILTESKEKVKPQELQNYVFDKISLTLPQDIIILMKYSGFQQKYNKISDGILDDYKKGEHKNFYNFIKTMKNPKNVIYSFTSIDEPLLINVNNDFETEMFGKINKNEIRDIQICSLSAENEVESELEKLYLDEGNRIKIVVFRFNPDETDIMNYINYLIENYFKEKNYEEKENKKAFIFSVHMNRIFEADKKDPKKENFIQRNELGETISHLSDFYQIFIDNLNGEDLSLIDLMKLKDEELFRSCLDLDKEFMIGIYDAFSYFKYDFILKIPGLDIDNYPLKIVKYLEAQKDLRESIINCILRQKNKKKEIFSEILKNNYISRDDIDIISVIKRYLSELFRDNLTQFVFKTEKDHFLSSFIYNQLENNNNDNKEKVGEIEEEMNLYEENNIKENNEQPIKEKKEDHNDIKIEKDKQYYMGNQVVKTLIDEYLATLDITKTQKFKKKIKNNKITLLIGLKLPSIKYLLGCFRTYIKNELSEEYLEIEKEMKYIYQDNDEREYLKQVNDCKTKIKNIQKNLETEIIKNELFMKLIESANEHQGDSLKFYEFLINDYYLLFLSDSLIDINNLYENNLFDYISILKKMIYLRFNTGNEGEEVDPIKSFARKILWLESNNEYISILLNIYRKLSSQEQYLYNKIESIIEKQEIKYDTKRSPPHTEEINAPFFYILESLLRIIITDYDIYKTLRPEKFYDFINSLKEINQNALRVFDELYIYSKEVFSIKEFLEIEEKLNNVNKSNLDNILSILKILSDQNIFTNTLINDDTKYEDLCKNIQILYDFLYSNLGETEDFPKLILNIFVDEIKKIDNENYRQKLVEIILSNPNLISISYPFISIILKGLIDNNPNSISDNLEKIQGNNYSYLDPICASDNDALNEIILSTFENQLNLYFESIPQLTDEELKEYFPKYLESIDNGHNNPTLILFDKSLEVFKKCLNFLEILYNNKMEKKDENINNELICKLYCIAFVKIYLFKCIYFNHYNNQELLGFDEIVKAIEGNAQNNFRRMVKVYAFKIFFYILKNNYYEFSNYHFPNHGITFFEEFKDKFEEQKEAMLSYYMLPKDDEYDKYKEESDKFDSYRFNNFNNPINQFKDIIEKDGIDIFYTVSSNIVVSNLALKNYTSNSDEYSKYSSFAKSLFSQLKISEIARKLFLLFSNDDEFNKIMKPKLINEEGLTEIDSTSFEILLYGLRFCLQTSNCENPNGLLFSELISKECEEKINQNCIPGNNILDDIYVSNYYAIERHLNKFASNVGAYVCSCGLYYDIGPCGFPNDKSTCLNCGQPTGNGPNPPGVTGCHGFAHREGHYRIFKDEAQKKGEFDRYGDNDKNIPNMLLNDYKVKIINPIIEKSKFGISKVSKIVFENIQQPVRKLSQAGYRLLSFILYSHLFYSNCLQFISNDNMKKYVCEGMTCIKMLVSNWNLLKDALQSKGIQIIQIFMNLIFKKLSEKIKNCKEIKTNDEREKFEEEIEKLLEESYKEYDEYSKKYLELNKEALELDQHNMKSLMLENNDIKVYDEENYPFYKYFLMSTYPSKENMINDLKKIIQFEKKYPLLSIYVNDLDDRMHLIKNLPEFNEFENFMIDYYSYKISREEASNRLLKDEEIYKNNQQKFLEKLNRFKEIWSELKPYATKYGCREEMPPIDLDENKSIAHFLNDNGEIGKGMYIAAAYQTFIEWQNSFLDKVIEPLRQNGILHHYVKNMEKTIDVQKAKNNEVLNFDKADESFMEIIYENSKRNIFRENNTVNYMNYKQFIYDFDSIEKSLGELILSGKMKFNGHENLKFVTYSFEGFRGSKSSVLTDFSAKYMQKALSKENKQMIYDSIKDKLKDGNEELSKILFSIQLLIYYLTQVRYKEPDEINTIIEDLPEYVTLSPECIDFFKNQKLKVEDITEVYSYIELLCFQPIIANLRDYYKKPIEKEKADDILKLFEDKKFKVITKVHLASACRKLISRYLVSTRDDTDYSENNKLVLYLDRDEMWTELWKEKENLSEEEKNQEEEKFKEDLEILRKQELILGQSYELYNLLGGDKSKALEGIKTEIEKEKEKEKKDDGQNKNKRGNIAKKHKKKY